VETVRYLRRTIPQSILGVSLAVDTAPREIAWMTANGSYIPSKRLMEDRPSPRLAVLFVAGSLALSGIARAQAQPPQQPEPAATDGDVFRLSLLHIPDTPGTTDVGARFKTIPPVFGPGRLSGDALGVSRFGVVNPNAPRKVGGGVTYSTANGTVLRAGFYGYANSRVPLFMNQTIGGGEDLTLPLVSFTDLSQQQMQWVLTFGIEKPLVTIPSFATIGGVGDVAIPLNTVTPPATTPDTQKATTTTPDTQKRASPMVRGGVKIGF
jgi:hypothetical protein